MGPVQFAGGGPEQEDRIPLKHEPNLLGIDSPNLHAAHDSFTALYSSNDRTNFYFTVHLLFLQVV